MNFPTTLWDLSLPTLPQQGQPGDDGDFLSILSKQIHGLPQQPQTTLFNSVSPVVSDEASPSPPAAPNKGLTSATDSPASGQTNGNGKRRPSDSQKRKASHDDISDGDDDDDEDSHLNKASKEQHSQRSKRKSSGADENRLMKRKEQNRAAQRAFRERKEKHVKDLEDKVAALEQKSQQQASENENLRDLLSRLQNENLMLKQSAFTFSFPNGASPNVNRSSRSTSDSPANIPESAKSTSFPSLSSDSPKTLNSSSVDTSFTPLLSFGSVGNATSTSSASSLPPTASSSSFASPHPVAPVQSQWTTIASNPLYTSYTDMDSLNQYLQQNGFSLPMDTQQAPKPTDIQTDALMDGLLQPAHDYENLIPFSSFTSPNPFQIRSPNSVSPVVHTTATNILPPPVTSSAPAAQPNATSIPRSQSPCGGAGPDEAPAAGSAAHHPDNAIMSIHKANSNSHVVDDGKQCPNSITEFQEIISKSEPSLFAPKDGVLDTDTMEFTEVLDHLRKLPCPDSNKSSQEPEMDFLCSELTKKVRCSEAQASSFSVDEEAKVRMMLAKCAKKIQEEHASGNAAERLFNPRRPSGSTSSNSSNATTVLRTPAIEEQNLANIPSSNLSSLALGNLDGMPFNFNPFLPMSYQQNLFDATLESLGGNSGAKGSNQMDVEIPAPQGVTSPNTAFAQLFGTNITGFSPSAYLSFDE